MLFPESFFQKLSEGGNQQTRSQFNFCFVSTQYEGSDNPNVFRFTKKCPPLKGLHRLKARLENDVVGYWSKCVSKRVPGHSMGDTSLWV